MLPPPPPRLSNFLSLKIHPFWFRQAYHDFFLAQWISASAVSEIRYFDSCMSCSSLPLLQTFSCCFRAGVRPPPHTEDEIVSVFNRKYSWQDIFVTRNVSNRKNCLEEVFTWQQKTRSLLSWWWWESPQWRKPGLLMVVLVQPCGTFLNISYPDNHLNFYKL